MYLYATLTLIATALTGATMGSFLLLTIIHNPLIAFELTNDQKNFLYRRFYRLNIALCLCAGIIAALITNQQAALVLTVLAISYIFANMHVLNGIIKLNCDPASAENKRALTSLKFLQNLIHVGQFIGAGWGVYYLY
jgi:hypothetical protein